MGRRIGWVTVGDGIVKIQRNASHSAKIGGRTEGSWIEARWKTLRFRVSADLPKSGVYPDDGCRQEVYAGDGPNGYVEMELLAPVRKLDSGTTSTLITHWRLSRAQ